MIEISRPDFIWLGWGSTIDVLGYFRRRPDSSTPVIEFSEWMTVTPRTKENIESNIGFSVDYNDWVEKLSDAYKQILDYLIQGFTASKIATLVNESIAKVRTIIKELRQYFVQFFQLQPQHA